VKLFDMPDVIVVTEEGDELPCDQNGNYEFSETLYYVVTDFLIELMEKEPPFNLTPDQLMYMMNRVYYHIVLVVLNVYLFHYALFLSF
jgi:hypothetical protein